MKRTGQAKWQGDLRSGTGTLATQSGALAHIPYSFQARFVDESGKSATNPEELLAAAHAGCYAMQLAHFLAENGTKADSLEVTALVELIPGTGITSSALTVRGEVPGIDAGKFDELANQAKEKCPVSGALSAITITIKAELAEG
jgi:lipoyl-dependent peroxiredoxin